ncbi:MAG: enoyl-CoA hydratase/isomerase family protein [Nakamurella sp.]
MNSQPLPSTPPEPARPGPHGLVSSNVRGRLGHIRLDRPAKINALNLDMIAAVRAALAGWRKDPQVVAVLIDGAGERGLCAGGDIAAVYDGIRGGSPAPQDFWADEYRMNLNIADYPKPVVALMHGITLGGGIGISGHASVRVVTDNSLLAMPETAIGLSPDVGGLYLLARAPGELGTHAALTGARLGPGDAITAELADYFVPLDALAGLTRTLAAIKSAGDVAQAVLAAATTPPPSEFWHANQQWIDECYAGDDAQEILRRLRSHQNANARAAGDVLAVMSPTAVAVTLRALRDARAMTLAEVLAQDLMLSVRFAAHHDFLEGIRAQIIDKDRNPHWDPMDLGDVLPSDVEAFFAQ